MTRRRGGRTVTKDGPADKAGIKDGDLIVEVDGMPVEEHGRLHGRDAQEESRPSRRDDVSAQGRAAQSESDARVKTNDTMTQQCPRKTKLKFRMTKESLNSQSIGFRHWEFLGH